MARAFSKHIRKNPVPDEDILSALTWIEHMVTAVRDGESMDDIPTADDVIVTDEDELTRPETDTVVV